MALSFPFLLLIMAVSMRELLVLASNSEGPPSPLGNTHNRHDPRIESTKEFYNTHVDDYIANVNKAGVTHVPFQHLQQFVQHMKENHQSQEEPPVLKVLELGCGYGRDVRAFCDIKGVKINTIGTDYSRSMLRKAQSLVPSVHFLQLDMRDLSLHFCKDSLDGIWACATMIHLPKQDLPNVLSSCFNCLRPNGILYVSVKLGEGGETFDPDARYGGIRKLYSYYQQEEFIDMLTKQGFTILSFGVDDHRKQDSYATNPFLHAFCQKPSDTTKAAL